MPVKLRKPKTRIAQISDEAIASFSLCQEIDAAGQYDEFEDKGGRRREYYDAHSTLHCELQLKPWEASPADVPDDGDCPYRNGAHWDESWAKAQDLRREILAAMKRSKSK